MSNKKKVITQKDLAHALGNKAPTQYVSDLVTKKHGEYHLKGSKAEKKIAKAACQHHVIDRKGNLKPRIEYTNGIRWFVACFVEQYSLRSSLMIHSSISPQMI